MSRRFNSSQRKAVYLLTGQMGVGDHIDPYSKGGRTDVLNCQLISKGLNMSKGSFKFEPRRWQSAFFASWDSRERSNPFLLIAQPGSGKTMAALSRALIHKNSHHNSLIIVIVPTENLKNQWKHEAANFGIELRSGEKITEDVDSRFDGYVFTYAYLARGCNRDVIRKLAGSMKTFVIMDEVHHCGDDSSFGTSVSHAFSLESGNPASGLVVVDMLLMSGTPWKSDGKKIPFIDYDSDGYAIGHFSYDYKKALTDKVIRPVSVHVEQGTLIQDFTGHEETLDSSTSPEMRANGLLFQLLSNVSGHFVTSLLRNSHERLLKVRQRQHDAGGIVVCIDQSHAVRVAKVLKSITGEEPSLIVSDKELENDTVANFRNGSKFWIVTVKKVSEGVDIPRLQVLCYLSNVLTLLFLFQVLGRILRPRKKSDHSAYVFAPAHPALASFFANISQIQGEVLSESSDDDDDDERTPREPDPDREPLIPMYSTRYDGTEILLIGQEQVSEEEYRHAERLASEMGVDIEVGLKAYRLYGVPPVDSDAETEPEPDYVPQPPLEDRLNALRSECQGMVNKIARVQQALWTSDKEFDISRANSKIHSEYQRISGKSQKHLDESGLQHKLRWLNEKYQSLVRPYFNDGGMRFGI